MFQTLCMWVLMIGLGLSATPALGAPAPAAQQSVLVISSDNLTYPYLSELYAEFRTTLALGMKERVRIYPESLDLTSFDNPDYRRGLQSWYREKYRDVHVDAVVVIGHASLKYLLDNQLWPDVPTYFVLASQSAVGSMTLPRNVTGQTSLVNLADMVHLAKNLLPDTTQMALVGNLPERDSYRPFHAPELAALASEIKFIDLRGMRYETLLQRVAALPEHTVIYHTYLSDDGSGRTFEPRAVLEATAKAANRPTFVDQATSVGVGGVGGIVFHPARQGHKVALRTMQLLRGESPAALPIEVDTFPPVFDWRQLQRWHIPQQRLPESSEVRFYQPSVWQQYAAQIAGALAVIVALSGLMVALLVERRHRAVAVNQSRRRLAEIAHMNRNATASVYSAAIAHELNQPLAAILSNAEAAELLLKQEPPALHEVGEILADIRRDDRRASDLILRMRNLLKKSDTASQLVDMNKIVSDALKFISGEAKMRATMVKTDYSPQSALVMADAVQIQQVLINLILNSLDAMSGMPAAMRAIAIRISNADQQVDVEVSDTGTGFDGQIERVFDSFFTTKSHGMGLGLSITAAIIQAHGGAIQAGNAPGGGARIRFQLPSRSVSS